MKNILQKFYSLKYDSQVLALICGFGVFRMIVELVMDVVDKSRIQVVAINIAIFALLLALLYTSLKRNFNNIHIAFGILLPLMLSLLILLFGGIHGYAKFNHYASLYFLVMIYSGYSLMVLLALNFVTLAAVLIIGILSPPWLASLNYGSSYARLDFWFTLIMLSSFSLYLKKITISQGSKLSALNMQKAEQVKESRKLSLMLQNTNLELKHTQAYLEEEVTKRTKMLSVKNESVEAFIKLNTTELIEAVDELLVSMKPVDPSIQYADKLKSSSEELVNVVETIRTSLQEHGWIDRKILRNYEGNA